MNDLEFYKGKTVLVTGHTGFKGSWLTKTLTLLGANVIGYALEPPTDVNMFDMLEFNGRLTSIIGDIRDLSKLKSVFDKYRPELVIHMAAQPIVRDSYKDPVYTYETNVMGTVNVMEAIRLADEVKAFINVTTDKVYDNKEWDRGYTEDDYLDGFDPYSNSKSCSELVTHSFERSFFSDRDIAVSRLRAGNVIGGGDFANDRLVPDCVRAAGRGESVIIRNPASVRPFQHVLEPVLIYLKVLMKTYQNKRLSGAYNVGPDVSDCINAKTLVDIFKKYWGEGFDYKIKPDNGPHEAGFLRLDCTKLKNKFAWKPQMDIDLAIKKSVEWYRAYLLGEDMNAITEKQILEFL